MQKLCSNRGKQFCRAELSHRPSQARFHRLPQVIAIWRKAKVAVFSIEVWQILLSCRADPAWNEGNDLVLGGDADFDEIGPGVLDGG